jgi:predicted Zn-dependent protease
VAFARSGERLAQFGYFDEAEDVLQRGAQALPESPWILRSYGHVARWRGDHALALERFTSLRDTFPGFATGHADFVHSLIIIRRIDEAETAASEARKAFPNNVWIADAHARVSEAQNDSAEALTRWQVVRSTWPGHAPALAGEVRALTGLGRFAEVDGVLASAGTLPLNPELWTESAERAERAGAWTFAASYWERFRAARPDNETGYKRGALALWHSGNAEDAKRILNSGLKRWPDSAGLSAVRVELAGHEPGAPVEYAALEPEQPATPAEPTKVEEAPAPSAAKKPERPRSAFGWLGW